MKKMKTKVLAVIATMAVLCMTLTGCGEKLVPADQTVGALFELAAKDDASKMKDLLGFASEEDVRSAFFEEGADTAMVDEIKSELTSAGIEMTDEEIQKLSDSMTTMLNKITYTAEITSEEKDSVVVTLKVTGFSTDAMTTIMTDAANTMTEKLTASEEDQLAIANGDMDVFNKYMQDYINDFMTGLAGMELDPEPVEITVTCEKLSVEVSGKSKVAWLPTDMDGFGSDIEAAMIH